MWNKSECNGELVIGLVILHLERLLSLSKKLHFFKRLYLIEIGSTIEEFELDTGLGCSPWRKRLWYMSKKLLSGGNIERKDECQLGTKLSFFGKCKFAESEYGCSDAIAAKLTDEKSLKELSLKLVNLDDVAEDMSATFFPGEVDFSKDDIEKGLDSGKFGTCMAMTELHWMSQVECEDTALSPLSEMGAECDWPFTESAHSQ